MAKDRTGVADREAFRVAFKQAFPCIGCIVSGQVVAPWLLRAVCFADFIEGLLDTNKLCWYIRKCASREVGQKGRGEKWFLSGTGVKGCGRVCSDFGSLNSTFVLPRL